ncbi:MAG: rod shape-determining protein RodA [Lentisphaerae bacterium]|nr:rod shape-determining protein RodA [Lentisphaerota bacterium]
MKKRWLGYFWQRLDWFQLGVMLLLLIVGVCFVYSADTRVSRAALGPLYQKQVLWIILGLCSFTFMALTDYHQWVRAAWWLYGAALLLLVLVFVPHVGLKIFGARRWIQVGGLFIFQPAELMKVAVVLVLARLFGWPGRALQQRRLVWLGLGLVLVPMLLISKQPDLGTALVLLPLLWVVMFAAGISGRVLGALAAGGLLLLGIMLAVVVLPSKLGCSPPQQERLVRLVGLTPYQCDRILVFLDSDRDPLGAGWSRAQSEIAVGSGRLWGKGYLQGTQNILGFLPRTVAPNDFIFSVIAEEKGFVGSLAVLMLFAFLIYAGWRTAALAADKMGRLLCLGIVTILFCHVFMNIAMTIGLMPVTGIPLPLISYGGTFIVGTLTALGMIQSVYLRGDWRSWSVQRQV